MKSKYLFYFCDGIGSVFDSQVLSLVNELNTRNIFKEIYLFLGIKNKNEMNIFLTRKVSAQIKVVFFKSYANYPFFNFMIRKSIQKALSSQKVKFEQAIFHTRGELIAFHLSKVLSKNYYKNIIPDVRAAEIVEIIEFSGFNVIKKTFKNINNKKAIKFLNKYHKISVVSNSLKNYLINNHNVEPDKINIVPCLAGNAFQLNECEREKVRKELNLSSDDILIVFSSGGTALWQNNDIIIRLAQNGFKVLNLSKKEISHNNIINKFVSYSEVPTYFNAADVGIIWRNKSIVNKVSSPVKFSEYICCGLPVIANPSVDMINEYIKKYNCGKLLNNIEDIDLNSLYELRQMDRKKISESALINFRVEAIVDQYLQTYSLINN
jgi:hypothetical protein